MSSDATTSAPAAEPATPATTTTKDDAPATAPSAAVSAEPSDKGGAAPAESKAAADSESAPAPTEAPAAVESDKPAKADNTADPESSDNPDVEMTDAAAPAAADAAEATGGAQDEGAADAITAAGAVVATQTPNNKKKALPRKSGGPSSAKGGKKLNRKQSKARITHIDAQPGDHFYVKLKGFPQWPVIICDESMLPQSLLGSRPVGAKRPDGTYREDFADGGKREADRTFPVMYLHTNEFGWVGNTELIDLDPATVMDVKMDKMRKDLQAAHELASENHPLQYYKDLLQQFQDEQLAQEEAKEKARADKAAKAAAQSKAKKGKAAVDDDEDVDMADAADDDNTPVKVKKTANGKRNASQMDEAETPRTETKKPKIKLTTSLTPKAPNGAASTPKSVKQAPEAKATGKAKPKKAAVEEKKVEKEIVTPKEPELTPEEKHQRREKEVLFLRHKLQKGLLTKDQEPKEEEMLLMSEYITKLEALPDLEVSIIRQTKINKVLKQILKLSTIPKEEELKFKSRSQILLDKWNKLLAVGGPPAAEVANGVNGLAAPKTNGVKKADVAEPEKGKSKSGNVPAPVAKSAEESETADKPAAETKVKEAVEASA
ncbi:PWWP domain-containing protein [Podospora didyma]|uniref:PWWP domain-containing protein n=1 Tax=Podospora didyma TaxID=330526 RepID=A0AAE0KAF0_9PEZI|nr:PWWP domain-containing protein [Podospora didyma]